MYVYMLTLVIVLFGLYTLQVFDVYHVIILYFNVLLPIVSILLCIVYMNCMDFTGM